MSKVQLINNQGNFLGGYFILNRERIDTQWDNKDNFYVTLPYQKSIKDEIISLIRNSKDSIKLCSFIITDKDVFSELEEVLANNKVAVFILTQLDSSKFSTALLTEEEMSENFNQAHLDIIKKLYSKGAHVRATRTAHAKFIISDRNKAFLTSANMTIGSLSLNPESGIYIKDSSTINHLDRLFDEIFQNGTEYTKFLFASENKQFVVSRQNNISEKEFSNFNSSNLRFTYEDVNHSLYNELVNTIDKSNEDIYISTYSIVGLELLPEFVKVVKSKIDQGLSVYILSRGMNYRSDHIESCTKLAQIGCKIYGDVYNHSKGIVSDYQSLIFTANIDGNHGLKNGFEVGAILHKDQTEDMLSFIKWQIKTAPYIFVVNPNKYRLFDTYSFYCNEKNITPKELPKNLLVKMSRDNHSLFKLIEQTPCYLKFRNNVLVQIQIGNSAYKARFSENTLYINEKLNSRDFNLESYLMQFKNLKLEME